jgi:hypothetical protein
MSGGPVGSPYPGTTAMLVIAGILATLVGKTVQSAFKRRRDRKPGVAIRPDARDGAEVFAAAVALCLLVMVLWAIWVHR